MSYPILILVDYRGAFWSSTKNVDTFCSLDVGRIREQLVRLGHEVDVLEFGELDLAREDLRGRYVIYTSSEDVNAHYKRYIEAKVLGLQMVGARPVPDPLLLLAHHDKVMMESVRLARLRNTSGQLEATTYGALEELQRAGSQWLDRPMVMKPSQGAGSQGVTLVRDLRSALRAGKRLSRSYDPRDVVTELVRRVKRRNYVPRSLHRRSVVLQHFLPGLSGDYKVLRYGDRFYVLGRKNRPNDFRASGGGRLNYHPAEEVDVRPLLDAAETWSDALGSPFCSLDVAYAPDNRVPPHLVEFQCVNFGPATAENSDRFYIREGGVWTAREEVCDLEKVFAEATSAFIRAGGGSEGRV